jgi:hypothetical protein
MSTNPLQRHHHATDDGVVEACVVTGQVVFVGEETPMPSSAP